MFDKTQVIVGEKNKKDYSLIFSSNSKNLTVEFEPDYVFWFCYKKYNNIRKLFSRNESVVSIKK